MLEVLVDSHEVLLEVELPPMAYFASWRKRVTIASVFLRLSGCTVLEVRSEPNTF